jgi:hypothetical protein
VLAGGLACGSTHRAQPGERSLGSGGRGGIAGGGGRGGHPSGSGGSVTLMTDAGAGGDCERDVTLQAVVIGEPAPFDLVIVADHSQSLAWSRDELSAGLGDLLTHVQGRSVRVFLLTPTQYGASSAAARMPLTGDPVVSWQDPATEKPYEDEMTTFSEVCTDPNGASISCPDPKGTVPYEAVGTWSFRLPEPVAVIRPDMTDAEFAAEQTAVKNAVLAIGGTGSPHEQPLCTLARYVGQMPSALPKNAVIVVISDEDDVSLPADCLAGFKAELLETQQESSSSACTSNCDVYRYTMQGTVHSDSRDVTCAAFTDTGDEIPGTEQPVSIGYGNLASCDGFVAGDCSADEKTDASRFCPSGLSVVSCERRCYSGEGLCEVEVKDSAVNPCSGPFTYFGQTFPNLAAFCPSGFSGCSGMGFNVEYASSFQGSYSPTPVVFGSSTRELGDYFRSTAATAFASGSYLLEGIVFSPTFSCTLGSGQSYATNIMQVIGDASRVFPLCASYAPALDGVVGFAETLLETEFTLTLAEDEHVTAVVIVGKNGAERTLAAGQYSFDPATGKLELAKSALSGTDATLRVEVTSDCRPLVR